MKKQNGFSLIELLVVVIIIGIIAAIAVPSLLSSRKAANEGSAIATVRTIGTAQATYQASNGGTAYATTNAGLTSLLDSNLSTGTSGTRNGYTFVTTGTSTGTMCVIAEPTGSSTGTRSFGLKEDQVVRAYTDNSGDCSGGTLTDGAGPTVVGN